MNKKIRVLLGFAAFAILMAGAAAAYNALQPAEDDSPPINLLVAEVRHPAPGVSVLDADGSEIYLSDLLGTPVVLNFWTSW